MTRRVQIPKEKILKAALDLLIRDGYSSLNIKTLAKELNCSTQPISWHFGNMEGLRKALTEYAMNYANQKMLSAAGNGMDSFINVGAGYIHIAFDEPNLFRYLYMSGDSGYHADGFDVLMNAEDNAEIVEHISQYLKIPKENAGRFVQNTIIYTHGLATFVVSGLIKSSKEQVMEMVMQAAVAFLAQAGADLQRLKKGRSK